jgi:hypothetical protein
MRSRVTGFVDFAVLGSARWGQAEGLFHITFVAALRRAGLRAVALAEQGEVTAREHRMMVHSRTWGEFWDTRF